MGPELRVLLVVAATLGFAYVAVYPRLVKSSLLRMMWIDMVLSALLLVAVGSVYMGLGVAFSLIFFSVPWWVFTLLATLVIEIPLFVWFCQRYGIDFDDFSDD